MCDKGNADAVLPTLVPSPNSGAGSVWASYRSATSSRAITLSRVCLRRQTTAAPVHLSLVSAVQTGNGTAQPPPPQVVGQSTLPGAYLTIMPPMSNHVGVENHRLPLRDEKQAALDANFTDASNPIVRTDFKPYRDAVLSRYKTFLARLRAVFPESPSAALAWLTLALLTLFVALTNASVIPAQWTPFAMPLLALISGFLLARTIQHSLTGGGVETFLIAVPAALATFASCLLRLVELSTKGTVVDFPPDRDSVPILSPILAIVNEACETAAPLPWLLPSITVGSLVLPTVMRVLPNPSPGKQHMWPVYVILAIVFATSLSRNAYFRGLPSRAFTLYDAAVYYPLKLWLPELIAGALLARLVSAAASHSRLDQTAAEKSRTRLLFVTALLAFFVLLVPERSSSIIPQLSLVPLSVGIYTVAVAREADDASIQTSARERARRVPASSFAPVIASDISPIVWMLMATFALQNSIWRFLTSMLCTESTSHRHAYSVCVPAAQNWLFSASDSPRPEKLMGGSRPSLLLWVFVLVLAAFAFVLFIVRPVILFLDRCGLVLRAGELTQTHSSISVSTDTVYGSPGYNSLYSEGRDISTATKAARLFAYYVGMVVFLSVMWKLSIPIAWHNTDNDKRPWYCTLPGIKLPSCLDSSGDNNHIFGPGLERILTGVVLVLQILSTVSVPVFGINILAHIRYPRVLWKPLPPVSSLLQNSAPKDSTQHRDGSTDADLPFVLYIRYVTRGGNPELSARNARLAGTVLRAAGVPDNRYVVEIVTDKALNLDPQVIEDVPVSEILVPDSFSPPNGTMYKARALQYAVQESPARDFDWIVHLDEETRFDEQTVAAILLHCVEQTRAVHVQRTQEWPSIGQGPIVYGRAMVSPALKPHGGAGSWVNSLADSSRVSDDCGRFRLQYEAGEVWVGMHGSYVVVANCVEKLVQFDHGAEGSIAEDAFFALVARSQNVRFAWIDAFMYEQSPFNFMDFVRQRARWLVGGILVCNSTDIPLLYRAGMKIFTTLWAMMPLSYIALALAILWRPYGSALGDGSWYYEFTLPTMAVLSLWNYTFGFLVTFPFHELGAVQYFTLLYLQLFLMPMFGVMEVTAVAYALVNFKKISVVFHVVEKDTSRAAEPILEPDYNTKAQRPPISAEQRTPEPHSETTPLLPR